MKFVKLVILSLSLLSKPWLAQGGCSDPCAGSTSTECTANYDPTSTTGSCTFCWFQDPGYLCQKPVEFDPCEDATGHPIQAICAGAADGSNVTASSTACRPDAANPGTYACQNPLNCYDPCTTDDDCALAGGNTCTSCRFDPVNQQDACQVPLGAPSTSPSESPSRVPSKKPSKTPSKKPIKKTSKPSNKPSASKGKKKAKKTKKNKTGPKETKTGPKKTRKAKK